MHKIVKQLQKLFPYGHPNYIPQCIAKMKLHSDKNYEYTKGGNPLGNFYRVSRIKGLYPKMDWATPTGVCIGYALKQFDAAMLMLSENYEGAIEGVDTRLGDVEVYIGIARLLEKENVGPYVIRT